MTGHVPADPVCLDLPDHELCLGDLPPSPSLEGKEPCRCVFSTMPCLSMAVMLHGLAVVFALALGMTTDPPNDVLSISLLPGLDAGPPPGKSDGSGTPALSQPAPQAQSDAGTVKTSDAERPKPYPVKARARKPMEVTKRVTPNVAEKTDSPAASVDESRAVVEDAATNDVGNSAVSGESVGSGSTQTALSPAGDPGGLGPGGSAGMAGRGGGAVESRFGEAEGPRFVERVMPRYPELARRKGREGVVVLRLTIDARGVLRDVHIVEKAGFGFDEAALEAVTASTYAPARKSGQQVDSVALLPVRFALKGS